MLKAHITILIFWIVKTSSNQLGDDLAASIKDFAERGGSMTKFEEYLQSEVQTSRKTIDQSSVNQLAEPIEASLNGLVTALNDLKNDVEEAYDSLSSVSSGPKCKDVVPNVESHRLETKVEKQSWCLEGDVLENSASNNLQFLNQDYLIGKWMNVYDEHKGIKYIKAADRNGILYHYPAKPMLSKDSSYDARFSQWFRETSSMGQREVIIMIDNSMSNDAIQIAQLAATKVIHTLSSDDRLAIVEFSDTTQTHNGKNCFESQLAKATDINKQYMADSVNSIQGKTATASYERSFSAAFKMFYHTKDDGIERARQVLLFTDGDTIEDSNTLCITVGKHIRELSNMIRIDIFGVGSEIQNEPLLTELSRQQCVNGSNIPQGSFTSIISTDEVHSTMYSYTELLSTSTTTDRVVFSPPYKDVFTGGYQLSICSPVVRQSQMEAVFCLDVALEYMLANVTYYNDHQKYAFLMDDKFRVLSHPLLPNIEKVAQEYFFISFSNVEIMDDVEMFQELISMEWSGTYQTDALRMIQQGSGGGQHVLTSREPTSYFFKKINISGTNFTVGIATSNVEQKRLDWSGERPHVYYHLDHTDDYREPGICKVFIRIALGGKLAAHLASRCFENAYMKIYYDQPTTMEISNYLNERSLMENPGLKPDIRDTLSVMTELEKLWGEAELSDNIVWRYIGTSNGMMIIYPGVEFSRLYDPTMRSWYKGATSVNGKLYITPPYVDASGAGTVITIARQVKSDNTEVVGVIGLDLTIFSFYYSITEDINECSDYQCILIDTKGFIVVHYDWIEDDSDDIGERDIHLTETDEDIAASLVSSGLVTSETCVDMASGFMENIYWEIKTDLNYPMEMEGGNYIISYIPNTNLFIIVKKGSFASNIGCQCQSSGACTGSECQCPCVQDSNAFQYCTESLNVTSSPPCFSKLASIDPGDTVERELAVLDQRGFSDCRDFRCPTWPDKQSCSGVLGCKWCTDDEESYCSTAPYCAAGPDPNAGSNIHRFQPWHIGSLIIIILKVLNIL